MLKNPNDYKCPLELFSSLVGGKYKGMIIGNLYMNGVMRFNELSRVITDATPKMLTQQLRELEKDGLIVRKVYAEVPPKVEYSISKVGKTLLPILESIYDWSETYKSLIADKEEWQ